MEQRRQYKNPPIEEALCQFRFPSGREWDSTIPSRLQVKLGDEYAGEQKERRVLEVKSQVQEGIPSSLRSNDELTRIHLPTKSGKRLIGVGPDVLSVHMLRPYQNPDKPACGGWEEFSCRIRQALGMYYEVVEPTGVSGIGIRYINKILIPEGTVKVEDYLKCALSEVDELPDLVRNFMSHVDYLYEDGVRLLVSQGPSNAPSGHVCFLLSLDVIWKGIEPVAQDKALEIVEILRGREREAFEAVITDKTRELFNAA